MSTVTINTARFKRMCEEQGTYWFCLLMPLRVATAMAEQAEADGKRDRERWGQSYWDHLPYVGTDSESDRRANARYRRGRTMIHALLYALILAGMSVLIWVATGGAK